MTWFPMRITYCQEEKIKRFLDEEGLQTFLPMRYQYEKTEDWDIHRNLVPAIHGLLFVNATQEQLTHLKMTRAEFEPMRYTTDHTSPLERKPILTVPDRQMENFMRVASVQDDRLTYLEMDDYLLKPGRRVRITDGEFAGAEGVIKRIKKRQVVVVQIQGLCAVAITFVPRAWLADVEEETPC